MRREIVTIQFGEFANFIGSHFWNFRDELLALASDPESDPIFLNHNLDMDVLYRSGENQQGVSTYTPRLLSVNFEGSLGSMRSSGTLYNEGSSSISDSSKTWFGDVDTQRSVPRKRNLFQQSLHEEKAEIEDKDIVGCLDKSVECWTDYSKSHYHPQSLYELSGLLMDSQDFNDYGIGKDEASRGEELCEILRFFVEECDHIQGIKFLVDDSGGGFSALAASVSEVKRAVDASYNTRLLFHNLSVSRCPLPVPLPFPSIFGNLVGRRGEILSTPGSDSMYRGSLEVHSLPVATRWRSSSVILPFLESRLGNLERLGIQRRAMGSYVASKWGFGEEELQDMRENLSNMVSKLSHHHSSDSDSD